MNVDWTTFLISKRYKGLVKVTAMDYLNVRSDHKPVYLELEFPGKAIGPSYYKFNNSLLSDDTYCNQADNLVTNLWQNNIEVVHLTVR